MPSSGSKKVGMVTADLGPFRCDNCQKWQDGVCYDPEVAKDETIPDYKNRLLANGHIMMARNECSNEFLSLNDKKKWDGKLPKKDDRKGQLGFKILTMVRKAHAAILLLAFWACPREFNGSLKQQAGYMIIPDSSDPSIWNTLERW